jgi:hypothetical protein
MKTLRYALPVLAALLTAPAVAATVSLGPEFHPPKGYIEPSFEQLNRSPNRYTSKTLVTGGRVFQVINDPDNAGRFIYLIQSEIDPYGSNSTIMVLDNDADRDNRILEGDRVILWGEFKGLQNYQTGFNIQRTVPFITAGQVMQIPKGAYR